ncbi:MAG TPA: DHCW motif cupin fold protein [Kofleriaceae bacterium]
MKLDEIPFRAVDWTAIAPTIHAGAPGEASWRTHEVGAVRARLVEYSPGYVADHWCERGHVVYVLEGELVTELRDGRTFTAGPGQGYVVASGDGAHRSRTASGAKIFIVD